MNREIKFKYYFQHEETGRMCAMIFDYLQIFNGDCKSICEKMIGYVIVGKSQFTGRLDTFDFELFDGDIVNFFHKESNYTDPIAGKIFYNHTQWYIEYKNYNGAIRTAQLNKTRFVEIIGSIYQNPELLK